MGRSKDLATGKITGNANDADGNLKVTTNTPANYPAMVIETSTGGNTTEVHGLHIKNTAAGHGLRRDDEASDTTPFVVASDGKVGVGTTTPYKPLTISGAIGGTKADILDIQSSTAGGGTQPMVRFGTEAGNANTLGRIGFVDIPSYGGGFVVETNSTGGATHTTTEKFRIDKDGRVTKPNQPSFNAYRNTILSTNTGSSHTLVPDYTGTRFNNGSHFNTSNGRFTAPVDGEYLFGVNNNMGSTHNVKSWRLYVNGSAWIIMSYADVSASWQNLSASTLVTLNANDYIQFAYRGYPDYGNDWLNVYGYLMG